jgi:short-subunit dehydrogenase
MTEKRPTALVTGASSGIGVVFAREYASRGYDLIIAARRTDRLNKLAAAITKDTGVAVKVVASDLSVPNSAAKLAKAVGSTPVDVLVNNAGWGNIGPFSDEDLTSMADEINVNVIALTQLSRLFVGPMIERGRGAIINIASTAAYQPVPNMAVYAATKAYVLSFTEALWGELQGTGVTALAVSPGGTATEFFEVAGGRAMAGGLMTPAQVVATAMSALDAASPAPSVIVGAQNRVMAIAGRFAPKRLLISVAKTLMKPNNADR